MVRHRRLGVATETHQRGRLCIYMRNNTEAVANAVNAILELEILCVGAAGKFVMEIRTLGAMTMWRSGPMFLSMDLLPIAGARLRADCISH